MNNPTNAKNLFPNYETPTDCRAKVMNHIYSDFSAGKQNANKKSLMKKVGVLRYASFGLVILLGISSVFVMNNQDPSLEEQKQYAQELNQILQSSQDDVTQLLAIVDEEYNIGY